MVVLKQIISYLLLPRMGITGAGVAWLASQAFVSLFVIANWPRDKVRTSTG